MEQGAEIHPASFILYPRRILIRGVNWLGDAVMTTPALARLRERFPDAHIMLLTHEKLRDLWRHHPSLDAVLTFSAEEGVLSTARRIRTGNCDLALILPNSPRSALESWLARIPQRLGYAHPLRNWLLTQPLAPRPSHRVMHKRSNHEVKRLVSRPSSNSDHAPNPATRQSCESPFTHHASRITHHFPSHHTHQYLHLVAALGADPAPVSPALAVTPDEVQAAISKFGLDDASFAGRPFFGLNPGAEYGPAKRWPADRFIDAAREIQKRTACIWLIFGGKADAPLADSIHSALRAPHAALQNLAGRTSLRELMALLKVCRVLLTNDTGPMHVAAALGTPVVVPFGSTSPELTAPGLPGDPRHRLLKSDAPCSPCFLRACPIDFRCMTAIRVEDVIESVLQAGAI